MGAVYEAVQDDLGRRVAIKVLLDLSVAPSAESLARFRIEAEAAARLANPHIVQVSDFQTNAGEPPFLVMELLSGQSLRELFRADGRMPWTRASRIGLQVLAALGAAHDAKIVHRDIKPANIFVVSSAAVADFVKVVDFGIAKLLEPQPGSPVTQAGAIVGTVAYMAPEQARGEAVDERSDLYSVAVCLYEAVAGQRPIQAAGGYLRAAVAAADPVPIEQYAPDVDPRFAAILRRAMERDPSRRYQTAGEMADALARIVGVSGPFAPETHRDSAPALFGGEQRVPGASAETVTANPTMLSVVARAAAPASSLATMSSPQAEAPTSTLGWTGAQPPVGASTALLPTRSAAPPVPSSHHVSAPWQAAGAAAPRHARPRTGDLIPWWVIPGVVAAFGLIVAVPGFFVLLGDRIEKQEQAFLAKAPPTNCPAPAKCTGTLKAAGAPRAICQPLDAKSYREGDVIFVKESFDTTVPERITAVGDGKPLEARNAEGDVVRVATEAIAGRYCKP